MAAIQESLNPNMCITWYKQKKMFFIFIQHTKEERAGGNSLTKPQRERETALHSKSMGLYQQIVEYYINCIKFWKSE